MTRPVNCKVSDWDEALTCNLKGDQSYYLDMGGYKIKYALCQDHYDMVNNL
jgi:hypothetical protein